MYALPYQCSATMFINTVTAILKTSRLNGNGNFCFIILQLRISINSSLECGTIYLKTPYRDFVELVIITSFMGDGAERISSRPQCELSAP